MVMKQPAFFTLSRIPENCVLFFNPLQASVLQKALQFSLNAGTCCHPKSFQGRRSPSEVISAVSPM